MSETCIFDIMELPEETLKKVLPKVSIRMVTRLIFAYPRAVGRTMLNILSQSMSPCTVEFVKDELSTGCPPTLSQIREAEAELVKTLRDERLLADEIPA